MSKLTEQQRRFVQELVAGATQEQAAIRAGYSEKTAAAQASRLLRNPRIAEYRRQCAQEIYDGLGLTAEKLALELEEIKRRCMAATPHLSYNRETQDWEPDGTWMFDAAGAVRAIKTQAQLMGIAARVELDTGERLEDFLRRLAGGRDF